MCACSDYMPKPKGYFRIDLPEKSYKTFHKDGFPCSFEYADNVSMVKTSDIGADSVWIDVIYPKCNARIYGTYRKVEGNFNQLSEEAYRLVYQPHVSKADGINTSFFGDDDHKVYGMFYELKGIRPPTSNSPCRTVPTTSFVAHSISMPTLTRIPSHPLWITSKRISLT